MAIWHSSMVKPLRVELIVILILPGTKISGQLLLQISRNMNMTDKFAQNFWNKLQDPFYRNWGIQLAADTVNYPFVLVHTLIQIGYEPLPPIPGPEFQSLLIENVQTNTFRLQSNFSYVKYIASVDGITGCFRGLFPHLCCHSIHYVVSHSLLQFNPLETLLGSSGTASRRRNHFAHVLHLILNLVDGSEPAGGDGARHNLGDAGANLESEVEEKAFFIKQTWLKLVYGSLGVVCSHPFYVIGVRTVAQFVGRETKYNSVFGSIVEIFKTEGFSGFFKGLIPRLAAETNYVIITSAVIFVTKKIFNNNTMDSQFSNIGLKIVAEYAANSIAAGFANPYLMVANTMIVNNSGLAIGSMPHTRTYNSWNEAMDILKETGQISRSLSKRMYTGPFRYANGQLQPSHYFGPLHTPANLAALNSN